jgi:hypothetical protein
MNTLQLLQTTNPTEENKTLDLSHYRGQCVMKIRTAYTVTQSLPALYCLT